MFEGSRLGSSRRLQAVILAMILAVAVVSDAAVIYFGDDRAMRAGLGLLMVAPIVWAAARLGVVERITESLDYRRRRQFDQLRTRVRVLLDEIRRLNWMAVDGARGFRSREAAMREMDAIE